MASLAPQITASAGLSNEHSQTPSLVPSQSSESPSSSPTASPSKIPSTQPTTRMPSMQPSQKAPDEPSIYPTSSPTWYPTTSRPTSQDEMSIVANMSIGLNETNGRARRLDVSDVLEHVRLQFDTHLRQQTQQHKDLSKHNVGIISVIPRAIPGKCCRVEL